MSCASTASTSPSSTRRACARRGTSSKPRASAAPGPKWRRPTWCWRCLMIGKPRPRWRGSAASGPSRRRAPPLPPPAVLWLHTHADLTDRAGADETRADGRHLWLDTPRRVGLDALRAALHDAAVGEGAEGAFSARARHVEAIDRAGAHLVDAASQLRAGQGELAAEDLRLAQDALGEITGRVSSDALLGRIFSSFCIGK
ncbi:MAG: hypothetical protein ACK5VV_07165 [Lysobacteraceae bacterium]